jgi:hypothetical protein
MPLPEAIKPPAATLNCLFRLINIVFIDEVIKGWLKVDEALNGEQLEDQQLPINLKLQLIGKMYRSKAHPDPSGSL